MKNESETDDLLAQLGVVRIDGPMSRKQFEQLKTAKVVIVVKHRQVGRTEIHESWLNTKM